MYRNTMSGRVFGMGSLRNCGSSLRKYTSYEVNIQSSNEWRLQTEEMMRRMMEERERFRAGQLPPDGPGIDQTDSPPDV